MSLIKQGDTWHFRKSIPIQFREMFGSREFKRTLRTSNKKQATTAAAAWATRLSKVFTLLRSGCLPPGSDTRLITALRASDLSTPDHDLLQLALVPPAPTQPLAGPLLSSLVTSYCAEKTTRGEWTKKTALEIRQILAEAVDGIGDRPAEGVRRADLVDWLAREREHLALNTIRKRATYLVSLWRWAVRHEHVPRNIADGITPRAAQAKTGRAYSTQELERLLAALRPFVSGGPVHRWMIPLVAMHSGLRLGEVCGLRCDEVRQISGVWSFDLTKRQTKTPAGRRLVPIHSMLLRAGLLGCVEEAREAGRVEVWDMPEGKTEATQRWGQDYQRLNRKEVRLGPGGVFHSLRHGFIGGLKDQGLAESMIAELVGHRHQGISFSVYADPYRVELKAEAVEAFVPLVDMDGFRFEGGRVKADEL